MGMAHTASTSGPNPAEPSHWQALPNAPRPGTHLGYVNDWPDEAATRLELPAAQAGREPYRLVLLRSGAQVHAFVNRCAHFGVPLAQPHHTLIFTPGRSLTCNVHYARYGWQTGACEAGDCDGVGLIPVPLVVSESGEVCIGHGAADAAQERSA